MQDAPTSQMLFSPAFLIAFLSALITLEPGDVVTTGTPAGVGCFRDPPVYLEPGDTITVAVDRIGELTNPVAAAWS
jgi:2-keto-4-pentenoate hydratase/2-oxohepta-3-ene-1,7-dioic acid hydratase in catechol pathway